MHEIQMTKEEQRGLESSGKRHLRNLNSAAAAGNQGLWNLTAKNVQHDLERAEREVQRAENNLKTDPKNEMLYQRVIERTGRRVAALRRLADRI